MSNLLESFLALHTRFIEKTFEQVAMKLQEQISSLSINENLEAIEKMKNVFQRLRDQLANIEFEGESDDDEEEMDEDLKAAHALLAELEQKDKDSTVANEKKPARAEKTEL